MYGEGVSKYSECLEGLDKDNPGHWYHIALLLSNRAACKLKVRDLLGLSPVERFFEDTFYQQLCYSSTYRFEQNGKFRHLIMFQIDFLNFMFMKAHVKKL